MIQIFLKSFLLIGILTWYSTGVWRIINDYFRDEFQARLKVDLDKLKNFKFDEQDHRVVVPSSANDLDKLSPTTTTTGNYNPNIINGGESLENRLKSKINYVNGADDENLSNLLSCKHQDGGNDVDDVIEKRKHIILGTDDDDITSSMAIRYSGSVGEEDKICRIKSRDGVQNSP